MLKIVAPVFASLAVLALAACSPSVPAPDPGTVPGTCLADYNGPDADRTSVVECTEEHVFDVLGTAVWPGMEDALKQTDPGELHDQLVDAGSTELSEQYWDWALPNCNAIMRGAIGLTGAIDGVSVDDLDAFVAGPWERDASLPSREAFIAGDHTTVCSFTWVDLDQQARTVAYPTGVTGLDLLAATFPSDQRTCFTRDPQANPSYRVTPCDEPHSGQYLLVIDGLPSLGADWLATKEVGVGFPDYTTLDDYCTIALDTVFPGLLDSPDWIVWSDDWGTAGWEDYDGTIDETRAYPMYCAVIAPDSGTITGDVLSGTAAP